MTVFRKLTVITGYLLAICVIVIASLASICSLFSPWLHEHREYFAKVASEALGREVALTDVRLVWDVTEPVLYLSAVKLTDPVSHKPLVAFDRVKVKLAVWESLLRRQWQPEGLVLVGSQITLRPQMGAVMPLTGGEAAALAHILRGSDLILKDISLNVPLPQEGMRHILLKKLYVRIRYKDGKAQFEGRDISLRVDRHSWPETHFSLSLEPSRNTLSLDTGYVDLADTTDFLMALSLLPSTAKKWVEALQPSGVVDEVHLSASSDVMTQGTLSLTARDVQITMDKVFEAPLSLTYVKGALAWGKNHETGLSWVEVGSLKVESPDGQADAKVNWMIPESAQSQLRVTSDFSVIHGENIARYLPLRQLNPSLVKWLRAAFLEGSVTDGHAVFSGAPADFPFDSHDGVFTISGTVHDVKLHFAPDWPDLQHIFGRLIFSSRKMTAQVESADISQMKLSFVNAVIPQMGKGTPVLTVTGKAAGDLSEGVQFIRASPLNDSVGKYLKGLDLTGSMQVALMMRLPLEKPEAVTLQGDLNLTEEGSLRLNSWHLNAEKMRGKLSFNQKGIASGALFGEMFAEPVKLVFRRGKTPGAALNAVLQGRLSVAAGEQWLHITPPPGILTGAADYEVDFTFPRSGTQPEISLRSTLQGIDITLDDWYRKLARKAVHFSLKIGNEMGRKIDFRYANFSGSISMPGGTEPVDVYLPRLVLGPIKKSMGGMVSPSGWSPVNFRSDDVSYGNLRFGRVAFQIRPAKNGLKVDQLSVRSPLFSLTATGEWRKLGSYFTGTLEAARTDRLLAAFGEGSKSFEAGPGKIQFDLSWPGSPFSASIKTLTGDVSINIGRGLITHLDAETSQKMGLGRMLSLFSLQTLPRRFSLDFSDLFQKGYGFDSIRGDFELSGGNAETDNAVVKGVVAQVNVEGRFGLAAQDYDLRMEILPHITSSLPVVTAIATANPLVGVAAWMLDKAVSPQVSKMATYRYRITGSWSHPVWQAVGAKS